MDLEAQIIFLRDKLLAPISTQFPDPLSDEDRVAVSSFLVLAHAAIEEALEDLFTLHLKTLVQFSVAESAPIGLARLCFHMRTSAENMVNGQGPLSTHAMGRICQAAFNRDFIIPNNGLKLENVKKLASGAGLYWTEFEDALNVELSDLSTLGTKRGSVGHLSPFSMKSTAITTSTDPSDVLNWVESGVSAIKAIERFLDASRSAGMPLSLISDWDGN